MPGAYLPHQKVKRKLSNQSPASLKGIRTVFLWITQCIYIFNQISVGYTRRSVVMANRTLYTSEGMGNLKEGS